MSEEDKDSEFKVEDKRRFDADGAARGGGGEGGSEEEAREDSRDLGGPAQDLPTAEPEQNAEQPAEQPAEQAEEAGPAGELSFSSFIVGLATQAFMFLGAVADPKTGLVTKDLGQAKALIDIIAMLGDKTAGNLSEDEARMMEEMLYELRMHYVNETRAPGAPAGGTEE